jgi:hypothetical protein
MNGIMAIAAQRHDLQWFRIIWVMALKVFIRPANFTFGIKRQMAPRERFDYSSFTFLLAFMVPFFIICQKFLSMFTVVLSSVLFCALWVLKAALLLSTQYSQFVLFIISFVVFFVVHASNFWVFVRTHALTFIKYTFKFFYNSNPHHEEKSILTKLKTPMEVLQHN